MIAPFGGDDGIAVYTWELARSLAENGAKVDVYAGSAPSSLDSLSSPRQFRWFPVLGSLLFKQRSILHLRIDESAHALQNAASVPSPIRKPSRRTNALFRDVRAWLLSLEFVLYLKMKGYDVIWTQWPDMDAYGTIFWVLCKLLRMRIVHTVHNVLPHERLPRDWAMCERAYRYADLLFVHSEFSRTELLQQFPGTSGKVVVSRHGVYTLYGRRPEARDRVRRTLGAPEGQVVLLFCGLIRPYKNIEAVIRALADPRCGDVLLIVAGKEAGYPDLRCENALARSNKLADESGVSERVTLLPGLLPTDEMEELLEAADVLMLPYLKSYGSGLLMLGMTFGKHIVATCTGGMEEYLRGYSRCTLLERSDTDHVVRGIAAAVENLRVRSTDLALIPPDLEWPNVARALLEAMAAAFSGKRGS